MRAIATLLSLITATILPFILPSVARAEEKTRLRVALFPYIPDAAGDKYEKLLRAVEQGFEAAYPTVDLELRALDGSEPFYDPAFVANLLAPSGGGQPFDVVEVDSVILGDLVASGAIGPWRAAGDVRDWWPASRDAVTFNGTIYGYPHLVCGFFLFSRDAEVAASRSSAELVARLRALASPLPDIAGDFLGSWEMTSVYLEAWADVYPTRSPADALARPADATVTGHLKDVLGLCKTGAENPCLSGVYNDNEESAKLFGESGVDSLFGYSERLHVVLRHARAPSSITITSAPLGVVNEQLLFTDSLTLRRRATPAVQTAALAFARYLTSPSTQEFLMMADDAPKGTPPRYLLPATRSALEMERVLRDPFYPQLGRLLEDASSFPSVGFLATREQLRDEVLSQVK